MAEMYVTHESPDRITLSMDPAWKAETSKTYAGTVKQGRGCLAICAAASLLILAIMRYSSSTRSLDSLPWSFWVLAVFVLLGTVLFVVIEAAFEASHKRDAGDATVTIDLNTRRAVRIEQLNSGRTVRYELDLGQVRRVLIHGDDAIHALTVKLETQDGPSLKVNSDVFYDSNPMLDLGKKLGALLQKPVVFKVMEAGSLISEETVQP